MATLADINETLKEQNESLKKVSDVLVEQIELEIKNKRDTDRQAEEDRRESKRSASRQSSSQQGPSSFTGGFAQGALGDGLLSGLQNLPQRLLEFIGISSIAGAIGLGAGRLLRFGGAIALVQTFGEDVIESLFESLDPEGAIPPDQRAEIAGRLNNAASAALGARMFGVRGLTSLGIGLGTYFGEEITNALSDVLGSNEFQIENPFGIGPENINIDLNDPTVQTVIGGIAGGLLMAVGRGLGTVLLSTSTLSGVRTMLSAMGLSRLSGMITQLGGGGGPGRPQPRGPDGRFLPRTVGPGMMLGTTAVLGGAAIGGAGVLDALQRQRRAEDIVEFEAAAAAGDLTAGQVAQEDDISFWRRAALSLGADPQNMTEQLDQLRRTVTGAAGSIVTGSVDALTGERVVSDEELKASLQNTLTNFIDDVDLSTLSDANLTDIEAISRRIGMPELTRTINDIRSLREGLEEQSRNDLQRSTTDSLTTFENSQLQTLSNPTSAERLATMTEFNTTLPPSVSVIAPEQLEALISAIAAGNAGGGGGGGQTPSFVGVPLPSDTADRRDW